jgi:Major Facilitator Superfamily
MNAGRRRRGGDGCGRLDVLVAIVRLEHRGGEPVLQTGLLRAHRSFGAGQALALLYFAGFTSLFFTLSILWQEGLGRSALQTGLLLLPFAVGSLLTASNSYRFSGRYGRRAVLAGICGMLAGQGLVLLVLRLSGSQPGFWSLVGPLLLAGLGNGLVIAPNQDFALSSVPRDQAGTAGGALITAQRLGAAIGIAVIGTALFGSGPGRAARAAPAPRSRRWSTPPRPRPRSTCASSPPRSCAPSACRDGWPVSRTSRPRPPRAATGSRLITATTGPRRRYPVPGGLKARPAKFL